MIKSVIAGAVAMAVVSFGVNAALTTPQGQGRVTFNGTVVDAPCSISQKSADQSIDFGQLSKSFLQAGGVSKPMNLDIELGNDSNLLIVFYVQIMPDDFVMQLHRF